MLVDKDIKDNKSLEHQNISHAGRVFTCLIYAVWCLTQIRSWCTQRGRTFAFWLPHYICSWLSTLTHIEKAFLKTLLVEIYACYAVRLHQKFRQSECLFSILVSVLSSKIHNGNDTPKDGVSFKSSTRVGTLIVATIYLQLIQNRYMFRSFTVLHCSHQHCVQPVANDVEVVGYL